MHIREEATERHTLAVIVDNEPGILARIAGLFTARGYNIESLTVSEITEDKSVSRITIVTSASAHVLEQITAQLDRLVPVHKVHDLTAEGDHVERELALVKVAGTGDHRIEALRLADVYRARVVDATTSSFVFEVTGGTGKIDTFVELMREVGLIEVARTGIVAISRGKEAA
ncbi:MAG: acetolactate synthase small subunit [Sphingomonas sp.]|uniref:acetolactate synthase small subunit n=1 Tax=Sphingomonas sp. TaxID=28214 RepID=UPI00122194F2|nr:acetolactate synthase small subunit [Sphingomonas sp.]THD36787.1 MAG: acetolactate synthase small subunit [Sphingomonas sp.]